MTVFDVREENKKEIKGIVFSESESSGGYEYDIGYFLSNWEEDGTFVKISDGLDFVLVESAEHARNLQKALDKAIELGWLK